MSCLLAPVLALTGCTASSEPSGPSGSSSAPPDAAAVAALLAARDAALTGGDAGAVPADDPLLLRAGAVPFAAWSTRVAGTVPAPGGADVRVEVTYRLPGDTRDVARTRRLAVRSGPAGPRVVTDVPDGAPADLWDLGPVRVVRQGRALVLAGPGAPAGAAEQLARDTDAAADVDDEAWGTGWRRDVVVLLPPTTAGAAALTGRAEADVARQAAVTVATVDVAAGLRGGDERVVLVPAAVEVFSATGRRTVLAHELGHVAARSGARFAVPPWLEEGLAEHVAWAGAARAAPPEVLTGALAAVAADGVPQRLPDARDFAGGPGGDPDLPYLLSWYACQVLAGDGGTARLVAVHRVASGRDAPVPGGPPAQDAAAAWEAALTLAGTDEDRLVTLWRREVARAARITP